ncbi:MAG TPA: FAD-dependent monooxygenase, partial [Candidatus Saccharimonadia bacterium]|nr:FAD-dependent monooxygenase [Candidatus Saccharimonadia bacterium]
SVDVDRGRARLALADGTRLAAQLAVAADGARSTLRALSGLDPPVDAVGSGMRALVANLRTERPHESTAWQRFTSDGPLAFLPLSNGECSIVWSLADARADELLGLDDDAFRTCVGAAFEHRLGAIVACSARAAFPLAPMLAPRYAAERVVLVGDAAHVVLPLAGQGLNLGLLDVAALCEVLADAGRDELGAPATLARYERWRRADNALAARAFELLDRLFRSQSPGIAWLRGTGLSLAASIAPLRREFALQASGFAGRVPALSRRLS